MWKPDLQLLQVVRQMRRQGLRIGAIDDFARHCRDKEEFVTDKSLARMINKGTAEYRAETQSMREGGRMREVLREKYCQ